MSIRILDSKKPPTLEDIQALEAKVRCEIPRAYLAFIKRHNGGIPEPNMFEIPELEIEDEVAGFLQLEEIPKVMDDGGFSEIPGVLPIAGTPSGNMVCLGLPGMDAGAIYFWDHEDNSERNGLYRIADDIGSFLMALQPYDPKKGAIKTPPGTKAWIDPQLLEEMRKKGLAK